MTTIEYMSPADGTPQPALLLAAANTQEPRPVLVNLHTWSANHNQAYPDRIQWCADNGWHFIQPNFRGPNDRPEALGSDAVVADIVAAVKYMVDHERVDARRVYLLGESGGGHAALLVAARAPELWAGVSAWVPISDVRLWWEQRQGSKYAADIEAACGGNPAINPAAARECAKRSPVTYLRAAAPVPLDINGGLHDGRSGSVPFTHSLLAFNAVAAAADRIAAADIEAFYRTQQVPPALRGNYADPLYGPLAPVFRRVSGNVRVTIFNGGHQSSSYAALNWLAQQRQGQPAVWTVDNPVGTPPATASAVEK
jgi:pimeloyl-ACP methyl ester carboxylesterase